MYVPNAVRAFGSSYKLFTVKTSTLARRYKKYLEVKRTHRKYLDKPGDICTHESNKPNMTACVAKYITDQIGCSVNIQGIKLSTKPPCNTTAQMNAFIDISSKLEKSAATSIYNMTGCLSSCEKESYEMSLENWSEIQVKSRNYRPVSDAMIAFTIYERSYVEEEQYVIYDSNSLFAEIGGFMGLVLGSSMLNIYDGVVELLKGLKFGMV